MMKITATSICDKCGKKAEASINTNPGDDITEFGFNTYISTTIKTKFVDINYPLNWAAVTEGEVESKLELPSTQRLLKYSARYSKTQDNSPKKDSCGQLKKEESKYDRWHEYLSKKWEECAKLENRVFICAECAINEKSARRITKDTDEDENPPSEETSSC